MDLLPTSFRTLLLLLILGCATAAVDNVITQWHFTAQRVVRTLGVPSQVASRTYTLLHLSQFKALQLAHNTPASHPEAAAAYAAHYVLSELYPSQQSTIFDGVIDKQLTSWNVSVEDDEASRTIGLKFAVSLLKKRSYDGSQKFVKFRPSPPGGPTGKYQFPPNQTYVLYPQFGTTRPFVVKPKAVSSFDTNGGPYKIPSAEYDANYQELATAGNANSSLQTVAFKETAKFWEGGANTSTINGQLFNVTLDIIAHNTSVEETAKLFTLISIAQYDSSIAGWQQKFKYLFWRPITALRQGDVSHQPITFTPYLRTPPHPEYPSTHSTASGSWAEILAKYLNIARSKQLPAYSVATEGYLLPNRSFHTLEAAAVEVGVSRVYGGIHFRKSINDGLTLGYEVADYVWGHFEEQFGDL